MTPIQILTAICAALSLSVALRLLALLDEPPFDDDGYGADGIWRPV